MNRQATGAPQPSAKAGKRPLQGIVSRLTEPVVPAIGWAMVGFTALSLTGELIHPGFDATYTWMPLQPETWWGTRLLMGAFVVFLAAALLRPPRNVWRYVPTQTLLIFLTLVAVWDGVQLYHDFFTGVIRTDLPFPFSWLVAPALLAQVARLRRQVRNPSAGPDIDPPTRVLVGAASLVPLAVMFLLGQFFLTGRVSHRRNADCIIVLGAAVHRDGRPSRSLYDRTRTGCRLYQEGLADYLIFSGGAGRAGVTEPQAMAAVAAAMGIPEAACVLDEQGLSTRETALSTRRIMRQNGWRSALVVSHDYHLSRTRLAFRRAGVAVHMVPARRSGHSLKEVRVVLREMLAWPYYYLRPLWQPLPSPTS